VTARHILGPGRIIGKSTHSLEQAGAAESEAVDYLAIGPVYVTPTKPDYQQIGLGTVREVVGRVSAPLVAIGGIEQTTVGAVCDAGIRCVAVVRAVCGAPDPRAAAQTLKQRLAQMSRAPKRF
jgi:thiamine-phosphate pyrophosphorylase